MSYLVDTNVLCEKLKRSPSERVVEWIARHESEIFVSVISIAATALRYDMPAVTRNVQNFKLAPVRVINPFDAAD